MSRFFETLKEASRSQMIPGATPPEPPADSPSGGSAEAVGVRDTPAASAALPDIPVPQPSPVEIPPVQAHNFHPHEAFFETFASQRNGFTGGTTVQIALDAKECLIPNATSAAVVERYRRLRSKLQQESATRPIKSLLIASPGRGEGKTITTLNLGFSFGMLPNFKVLVVDGDLRRGKIAHALGVDNGIGLCNLLNHSARLDDVVMKSDDVPFSFVLSGRSRTPAAELLTSAVLRQTITEMTQHFDLVLVDSPPVNLFSDSQSLAGSCDGALVVARAFVTTNKALEKTFHDLLPFRIVGTVLNAGSAPERNGYNYKGYGRADA